MKSNTFDSIYTQDQWIFHKSNRWKPIYAKNLIASSSIYFQNHMCVYKFVLFIFPSCTQQATPFPIALILVYYVLKEAIMNEHMDRDIIIFNMNARRLKFPNFYGIKLIS